MTVAPSHVNEPPPLLRALLHQARRLGASDVHLRSGQTPWLRTHGQMQSDATHASELNVCSDAQLRGLLHSLLAPADWARLEQGQEIDLAWRWPEWGRFRVNAFACEQGLGLVMRCIDAQVRSLRALQVPSAVEALLQGDGLMLVTGPTGSGKSTTLAAMVAHLNAHARLHVLTLEDPIEFVHTSDQCLITQREMGRDSHGFAPALRAALREDPDVLLVGEMRDLETIRLALTAAETGHLVLASLHSRHASAAIDRILDVFDASEKALVRTQLADSLRGVLAQTLVTRADGDGRFALYELLVATPAVRHLIREGKTSHIASAMQTGAAHGMVTLAQSQQQAERDGRLSSGRRHPS